MKKISPFMQTFEQLPNTLPIFPLNNAVVMPGGHLPLNIFETRYLNMLQDAMQSHRLIGMIQPLDKNNDSELYQVGCAARVTRYEETNDGRIELSLTGLCRFEIQEELKTIRGYRLIVPNWSRFNIDFEDSEDAKYYEEYDSSVKSSFISALQSYFNQTEMKLDWEVLEKLSTENLFNALFYFIEIADADKQMLLEIDNLQSRIKALTAIIESNFKVTQVSH
ncbi:MAG: Lon protease-like protein [Cocleimonas sp.]|jgi:Lon protease-like protein